MNNDLQTIVFTYNWNGKLQHGLFHKQRVAELSQRFEKLKP